MLSKESFRDKNSIDGLERVRNSKSTDFYIALSVLTNKVGVAYWVKALRSESDRARIKPH